MSCQSALNLRVLPTLLLLPDLFHIKGAVSLLHESRLRGHE